eukprot:gene6192-6828_t
MDIPCFPEHEAFAKKYFHIVDDLMDGQRFAEELFEEDASFTISNFPTSVGKDAIIAGANMVFNAVDKLKHNVVAIHSVHPRLFWVVGSVTYTMKTTHEVLPPLPLASLCELSDDPVQPKLRRYQAFLDQGPFIAAMTPK